MNNSCHWNLSAASLTIAAPNRLLVTVNFYTGSLLASLWCLLARLARVVLMVARSWCSFEVEIELALLSKRAFAEKVLQFSFFHIEMLELFVILVELFCILGSSIRAL